jgi:ribosomal protein S24E
MDLSVDNRSKNELMGRDDVAFTVKFESAIPSRKQVREALATAIGVPAGQVVLVRLRGGFGVRTAKGLAHAYNSSEALNKNEKKHLLIRDGLAAKVEKKAEPKKAPPKK